MTRRRKLIDSETEGRTSTRQHRTPCSDCPWRRDSLPGWLGALKPDAWIEVAHGESRVDCHVITNQQCAGVAVYRANVCKTPRDAKLLQLPADRAKVFAWSTEFLEHHKREQQAPEWLQRCIHSHRDGKPVYNLTAAAAMGKGKTQITLILLTREIEAGRAYGLYLTDEGWREFTTGSKA